ncbi:MAG: hypothetical protein OMM_01426 [Candidatus Magnetoglobus multicellularis str. Araruama]|uniref:TPR repeat-containing protein n=1 Tax=Candidatus Magnetoglobus multicellularis str. Araruama TaxID=890399 RepID=A0A1V1PD49_9BACT|nr:MAG: hypothetical protein OMM_01426 [Candidatus Magnetoglobus multicellularis str. Araruama]
MNFNTNPANSMLDSAVLAYKQNQFDRAAAECSQFLQNNPNNASALYLYGLVLQKQGNNDLAIDYINKAISTDATQIASFQTKLTEPIQQNPVQPEAAQSDDDPFKATRELLKRFEQEQSQNNNQMPQNNQQPFSVNTPPVPNQMPQNNQQPFSMNTPPVFQQSANNSAIVPFIQELYSQNFSACVLFWPGVESKTIGSLNQFPGMKFSIRHDEFKSHDYYTEFLKDIKLRSLSVVTDEKVFDQEWDVLILPYMEINNLADDPVSRVPYKCLYLANGFMEASDRQALENVLQSKGCSPKANQPCVFERKGGVIEPHCQQQQDDNQLKKGEEQFEAGNVQEAIKCFENILATDPNNADALNNLGVISFMLGNAESAEIFLLKTLENQNNHVNAMMNLADVYCANGLINEAAKYLTNAIDLEPKNPAIWASLSAFYKQIGSNDEALAAQEKCDLLKQSNNQ